MLYVYSAHLNTYAIVCIRFFTFSLKFENFQLEKKLSHYSSLEMHDLFFQINRIFYTLGLFSN